MDAGERSPNCVRACRVQLLIGWPSGTPPCEATADACAMIGAGQQLVTGRQVTKPAAESAAKPGQTRAQPAQETPTFQLSGTRPGHS
jgi:hypothetical protein